MSAPPKKEPGAMGPLMALVLGGMSAWLGYRRYRDEVDRIAAALKEAERSLDKRARAQAPTLEKDPATGVYRPARKRI